MAKKSRRHSRDEDGMVFSTNKDLDLNPFAALAGGSEETDAGSMDLRVQLDKKQRRGKKVTLVTGFEGSEDELKELGKLLKNKCGVGGAAKDGEIMVQGDVVAKVIELLKTEGYKVKRIGG